jgi:hypothetical protein
MTVLAPRTMAMLSTMRSAFMASSPQSMFRHTLCRRRSPGLWAVRCLPRPRSHFRLHHLQARCPITLFIRFCPKDSHGAATPMLLPQSVAESYLQGMVILDDFCPIPPSLWASQFWSSNLLRFLRFLFHPGSLGVGTKSLVLLLITWFLFSLYCFLGTFDI